MGYVLVGGRNVCLYLGLHWVNEIWMAGLQYAYTLEEFEFGYVQDGLMGCWVDFG